VTPPVRERSDKTEKKAKKEKKEKKEKPEKQASRPPKEKKKSKRNPDFVSDEEVSRGPPPRPAGGVAVVPSGPPISIGIGIPLRGGGGYSGGPIRGGGHSGGTVRTAPMGGQHIRR
jgi:hypothetical protein